MTHWIDLTKDQPKDDASYDLIVYICRNVAETDGRANRFVARRPFMPKFHVERYQATHWIALPNEP